MSRARASDLLASALLSAIVVALVAPAILDHDLGSKAYDHALFHLPLVREWAATWPRVPLADYHSATGPLYHWIMAGVAQVIGTDGLHYSSVRLQLASAGFGVAAVLVVFRFLRSTLDTWTAFAAAAALAVSPYLLGNATWMMTDNLSLALVAWTIGAAAFLPQRAGTVAKEGLAAGLAVATRQINLWLLGPMLVGWFVGEPRGRRPWLAMAFAAAAPVATLGFFVALWHGLVPPQFKSLHASGLNPAAIGFTLTLVAGYGVCLLAGAKEGLRELLARPRMLVMVLAIGAILAAIGPSFASLESGRNGGWVWRSVAVLPTIAGRSPLILLGGAVGALVLAALWCEARRAGRAGEAARRHRWLRVLRSRPRRQRPDLPALLRPDGARHAGLARRARCAEAKPSQRGPALAASRCCSSSGRASPSR